MSMASGAPLRNDSSPVKVTYLIMGPGDVDGRGPSIPLHTIQSQAEAVQFVDNNPNYTIIPIYEFETAKAAKKFKPAEARKRALDKLDGIDLLALGLER